MQKIAGRFDTFAAWTWFGHRILYQLLMPRATTASRMYTRLSTAQERFGEILIKRRSGSFEAERVELHEATIKVAPLDTIETTAQIIGQIIEKAHKQDDHELIVPARPLG